MSDARSLRPDAGAPADPPVREELARHMPPAVARAVLGPGGAATLNHNERRDVVVLCADMRGFTQTSQVLPPPTVLALLDAFFSAMGDLIESNGGELVNLQGDTLIAAFDGGTSPGNALRSAVEAAQQMQTAYQAMADEWAEEFGIRTALGIGINRGEAVVGVAGAQRFQSYMVFGDCVELAVRFMHRARAGEIVFSAALNQAISASGVELGAEALPQLVMGGREPVQLFGVTVETRLDFT